MSKNFADFLPKPESTEKILVQAKLPAELHGKVREQIEKDKAAGIKMDWTALIEAACNHYLACREEENAERSKAAKKG